LVVQLGHSLLAILGELKGFVDCSIPFPLAKNHHDGAMLVDRHECWCIVVDSYPYLFVRSFIDLVGYGESSVFLAMHHMVFAAEHCPKKIFPERLDFDGEQLGFR
jgi:hypothetical protein